MTLLHHPYEFKLLKSPIFGSRLYFASVVHVLLSCVCNNHDLPLCCSFSARGGFGSGSGYGSGGSGSGGGFVKIDWAALNANRAQAEAQKWAGMLLCI